MSEIRGEPVALAWEPVDEQKITYVIKPTGGLVLAESLGRQLSLLAKILQTSPDKDDPRKWKAFVRGICTNDGGHITIDFIVASKAPPTELPSQDKP